jgi:hypothetical protein
MVLGELEIHLQELGAGREDRRPFLFEHLGVIDHPVSVAGHCLQSRFLLEDLDRVPSRRGEAAVREDRVHGLCRSKGRATLVDPGGDAVRIGDVEHTVPEKALTLGLEVLVAHTMRVRIPESGHDPSAAKVDDRSRAVERGAQHTIDRVELPPHESLAVVPLTVDEPQGLLRGRTIGEGEQNQQDECSKHGSSMVRNGNFGCIGREPGKGNPTSGRRARLLESQASPAA